MRSILRGRWFGEGLAIAFRSLAPFQPGFPKTVSFLAGFFPTFHTAFLSGFFAPKTLAKFCQYHSCSLHDSECERECNADAYCGSDD